MQLQINTNALCCCVRLENNTKQTRNTQFRIYKHLKLERFIEFSIIFFRNIYIYIQAFPCSIQQQRIKWKTQLRVQITFQ